MDYYGYRWSELNWYGCHSDDDTGLGTGAGIGCGQPDLFWLWARTMWLIRPPARAFNELFTFAKDHATF